MRLRRAIRAIRPAVGARATRTTPSAEFKIEQRRERSGSGPGDAISPSAATTSVSEIIRDGDSFEVALKRFGRKVQQAGILSEAKRRRHYEPPSVKRKRKADARRRKELKRLAKAAARGY